MGEEPGPSGPPGGVDLSPEVRFLCLYNELHRDTVNDRTGDSSLRGRHRGAWRCAVYSLWLGTPWAKEKRG